jgi:hypothetical protein
MKHINLVFWTNFSIPSYYWSKKKTISSSSEIKCLPSTSLCILFILYTNLHLTTCDKLDLVSSSCIIKTTVEELKTNSELINDYALDLVERVLNYTHFSSQSFTELSGQKFIGGEIFNTITVPSVISNLQQRKRIGVDFVNFYNKYMNEAETAVITVTPYAQGKQYTFFLPILHSLYINTN